MIIIRPHVKELLPTFNYYIFRYLQKDFLTFTSGSAQPQLPIKDLNQIGISIPPILEQAKISSILSSIDNKINLLHRQNKTLEQLAETLFRQWFVEERLNNGTLGDVIDLVYGKTLKEEMRSGTGFPVIGSSGLVGFHSEYFVEAPGIVIGRKGTLGKVNYQFENFYPIDTTYFVKSKIDSVGLFYEYFLLKTLNFEEMNSDSAVPGLNRDIALSSEINIAPIEKISEFNAQCLTIFSKIKSNQTQIQSLTKMRDTLLPKLMSGEIRVKMPE
jgi:type I restriction enzyme S subunit